MLINSTTMYTFKKHYYKVRNNFLNCRPKQKALKVAFKSTKCHITAITSASRLFHRACVTKIKDLLPSVKNCSMS